MLTAPGVMPSVSCIASADAKRSLPVPSDFAVAARSARFPNGTVSMNSRPSLRSSTNRFLA